jgi:hypothetical protein
MEIGEMGAIICTTATRRNPNVVVKVRILETLHVWRVARSWRSICDAPSMRLSYACHLIMAWKLRLLCHPIGLWTLERMLHRCFAQVRLTLPCDVPDKAMG